MREVADTAGQRFASVYLENTGAAACTLAGMPRVRLLDSSANPLNVTVRADGEAPVDRLPLLPEQSAGFALRWSNWCGVDPGEVLILVTPTTNGEQITTSGIGIPPCLGPGQASTFDVTLFRIDTVVALD